MLLTEELLHYKVHRSYVHVWQGIIMLVVSRPCSDCACFCCMFLKNMQQLSAQQLLLARTN